MIIEETVRLDAPRERIWSSLKDPSALKMLIPGIISLEPIGKGRYTASAKIKLGFLSASFKKILIEQRTDDIGYEATFNMQGEEVSKLGSFKQTLHLTLLEEGSSSTSLKIRAEITLTGKFAGLGRRVVEWKAKELTAEAAKNLSKVIG
ncbi:MAG: hypothetical protein HYU39_04310 [Thaumarchaeota archaeon]|nr:hypothetical protein [Nitrososphaerota archaeon]